MHVGTRLLWILVFLLKGTVAWDFFHESTPYSPRIHTIKYFWILFAICGNSYLRLFLGVWYPAGLCLAENQAMQDVVLWQDLVPWGLIPRRILFCGVWYLAGFCSAGYQTPTGKLRPHRIRRKSFESLPFSLKGHFSKIVCMYKLHYPRLIGSMLKEPPILKMFFCSAGHDTWQNHFWIRISRRIWNVNQKYFGAWTRGSYGVDSWKKPAAKILVLLYL